MSPADQQAFDELAFYTLAHGGPDFIHQHIVDAFAAQSAHENSKPIGVTFALVGLLLHVECGQTGRQVQHAHMRLAKVRREWPRFTLPGPRGEITVDEVLAAPPGAARDAMIDAWCEAAWAPWRSQRDKIVALLQEADWDLSPR